MNGLNNLHIDLGEAVLDSGTYTFKQDIERAINQATSITMSGIALADNTFNAVPAWYTPESKFLFYGNGMNHFTVSGNTLTIPESVLKSLLSRERAPWVGDMGRMI